MIIKGCYYLINDYFSLFSEELELFYPSITMSPVISQHQHIIGFLDRNLGTPTIVQNDKKLQQNCSSDRTVHGMSLLPPPILGQKKILRVGLK